MQPLAPSVVAVAVVIPHPPHNGDSSSATQPHHPRVCSPITHEELALATRGELEIQRVNDVLHDSALGLLPAQCSPSRLMPRDLATICPSFFFRNNSPHGDCRRQEAPLDATILPWHSTAWHGIRMGEIWGCTGRLLPWFHSALW